MVRARIKPVRPKEVRGSAADLVRFFCTDKHLSVHACHRAGVSPEMLEFIFEVTLANYQAHQQAVLARYHRREAFRAQKVAAQ
jgi:hypothetical protein